MKNIKAYMDIRAERNRMFTYCIVDELHTCARTHAYHEFSLNQVTEFLFGYKKELTGKMTDKKIEIIDVYTDCPQLVRHRKFLKNLKENGIYLHLHNAGLGAMTKVVRHLQRLTAPAAVPPSMQWAWR